MKNEEIKQQIDQAVIDYVERKISAYDISKRLSPLANDVSYRQLGEAGMDDLVGLLDILADTDYHLTNKTFNHHDPGNVLNLIDKHYQKIKA